MSGQQADWAKVGAIAGAVVSVAANVAHALIPPAGVPDSWTPDAGAVIGAVWWPLALFLALEVLISERWGPEWYWVLIRIVTVTPVSAVAAVVSYHHLSGLLDHWSEDAFTVKYGPVAVDGLMILCSAALYRRRQLARQPAATDQPANLIPADVTSGAAPADPWAAYSVPVSPSPADVAPAAGDTPGDTTSEATGDTTPGGDTVAPPPGDTGDDIPAGEPGDGEGDTSDDTGDTAASWRQPGPDEDPVRWLLAERRDGRAHTGVAVGRAYGRPGPAGARWGQRIVRAADKHPQPKLTAVK